MQNIGKTILSVENLSIGFRTAKGIATAVDKVSFEMHEGEMLALVGESGSGKSITALSLLGLLPKPAGILLGGCIAFQGEDLVGLSEEEYNKIRGNDIAMIFQEPMTALNPVLTIGWQIEEVLRQHQGISGKDASERARQLLEEVGIPDAARRLNEYPHQMSGGMRQRVMIAIALACRPKLLIADEPTTALDVTVQVQIMELLAKLRREHGTAILLITHNLALVKEQADRVAVMYAGRIVEMADRRELFAFPTHPYTHLLMRSIPSVAMRGRKLAAIYGQVPPPATSETKGCAFADRCPYSTEECFCSDVRVRDNGKGHIVVCNIGCIDIKAKREPIADDGGIDKKDNLLSVKGLKVHFPVKGGLFQKRSFVHAVNGIDLELSAGETVALVGESGCGKTTVGKALIRLVKPTDGSLLFKGEEYSNCPSRKMNFVRRGIQMIFQDPFASLDPRLTVGESIAEGMDAHGLHKEDRTAALEELMSKVGLPSSALRRYPHQFSGGQRQRIGVARALAVQPELIICDECTSALDVSVQAQILNLLKSLQENLGVAYLFITHDLSVVSFLADRIIVMYLGKIMEQGSAKDVLENPQHPYTKALISAAPRMDDDGCRKLRLEGEVPSPINPPEGCPFHPRCPFATSECSQSVPELLTVNGIHRVACHKVEANV